MAKGKNKVQKFAARSQKRPVVSALLRHTPEHATGYTILEYGKGNTLIHDMVRTFSESPTAMLCWDKRARFIKANGFAQAATGKLRVNPLQTLDDLLPALSFDAAAFGFALRVKYNTAQKVGEVYHVPFQHVLKLTNGQFLINPTLGTSDYDKKYDEVLDAFDDRPEAVQAILANAQALDKEKPEAKNQPGQLLYAYLGNSLTPHYPVPACWAGRVDMETEPYILKADKKGLVDRVRAGIKVFIPGALDNETTDERGQTDLDKAHESVAGLFEEDTLYALFTGATKDDTPQFDFLDSFTTLGSSAPIRETVGRAICRWWGLPPELLGWSTPGQLGNKEQLETIVGMLQQDVLDIQSLIQRTVERLFPAFDGMLTNYNILGDIPARVWDMMTPEEKRDLAGLPELTPTTEPNGANARGFLGLRAFFSKRQ
jgi:hypothetical protein